MPVQIDSSAYVERLVSLSNNFVPLLKAKIQEQKKVVDRIRKEYDECCADKDYILYKKIYDKYYNKKKWYSASKFKICWQLLHLFKHIVPSYNLKEIREHFYPLKVRIEKIAEIDSRLYKAKNFLSILEKNLANLENWIEKCSTDTQ